MAHRLTALIARPRILSACSKSLKLAGPWLLQPHASWAVLPLDDDARDQLHRVHGTGRWHSMGLLTLSSSDQAFCQRLSSDGTVMAFETNYAAGDGYQAAAVWSRGQPVMGPVGMARSGQLTRPAVTWPINAALRILGVQARPPLDAFAAFGLADCRSAEAVAGIGRPV